jgi:hypothetical protein
MPIELFFFELRDWDSKIRDKLLDCATALLFHRDAECIQAAEDAKDIDRLRAGLITSKVSRTCRQFW